MLGSCFENLYDGGAKVPGTVLSGWFEDVGINDRRGHHKMEEENEGSEKYDTCSQSLVNSLFTVLRLHGGCRPRRRSQFDLDPSTRRIEISSQLEVIGCNDFRGN
jgi:hypothetical protein